MNLAPPGLIQSFAGMSFLAQLAQALITELCTGVTGPEGLHAPKFPRSVAQIYTKLISRYCYTTRRRSYRDIPRSIIVWCSRDAQRLARIFAMAPTRLFSRFSVDNNRVRPEVKFAPLGTFLSEFQQPIATCNVAGLFGLSEHWTCPW